ncbi:MAG: hypothetical protein JNM27_01170 [Leptospirales bacterium]|nr:hypothetical protein [Leptospirales bacterium]
MRIRLFLLTLLPGILSCVSIPERPSFKNSRCAHAYYQMVDNRQLLIGSSFALVQFSFWGFVFFPPFGIAALVAVPVTEVGFERVTAEGKQKWDGAECES